MNNTLTQIANDLTAIRDTLMLIANVVKENKNEKENFPPAPPIRVKEKNKENNNHIACAREGDDDGYIAPTAEEINAYGKRSGYVIDTDRFIDHWNKENWKNRKTRRRIRDWEQAVRRWYENDYHPPTVEEVRALVKAHNYLVDPDFWWKYYKNHGWKVGNYPMSKDWQGQVELWHLREVKRGRELTSSGTTGFKGRYKPMNESDRQALEAAKTESLF